jgi:predicted kinase/L-amino acid N-acyltransferase YncA
MSDCLFLHGPSGSGKTTLASSLSDRLGWRHIDRDDPDNPDEIRSDAYQRMKREISEALKEGVGVIVDAPFLYETREEFLIWVDDLSPSLDYKIISLMTPALERKRRRKQRSPVRDFVEDWTATLREENEFYNPYSGSLRLPGTAPPSLLEEVAISYLGLFTREIKRAQEDDIDDILHLKRDILSKSFPVFLYEDEMAQELEQVATRKAVVKMIEDNEVFILREDGHVKAIASLSYPEEVEGKRLAKLFSVYSRGEYAGITLGYYLMSRACDLGVERLEAWVYRDNEKSKRVLVSAGFTDSGFSHENKLVPRVPVEHWHLDLKH